MAGRYLLFEQTKDNIDVVVLYVTASDVRVLCSKLIDRPR